MKQRQMQDGAPRKLLKQFRVDLPPNEGERQHFAQKLDEAKKRSDDDSEPLQVAYANQATRAVYVFVLDAWRATAVDGFCLLSCSVVLAINRGRWVLE